MTNSWDAPERRCCMFSEFPLYNLFLTHGFLISTALYMLVCIILDLQQVGSFKVVLMDNELRGFFYRIPVRNSLMHYQTRAATKGGNGPWQVRKARPGPSFSCSLEKVLQEEPRQNSKYLAFKRAGPGEFGPVSTLTCESDGIKI